MTDRAAKTTKTTTKTTQTSQQSDDTSDLQIRASDTAFARDADSPDTEVARPDAPVQTGPGRNQPSSASNLQVLASAVLAPLGYELLEVQVQNPGKRPIVVVRIDRQDEQPVSIEDLAAASRAVSAEYDRLDPITGEYRLELESPGAKRPLFRTRHFERMLGLKARVRGDGHSFTGPITAVSGEDVTFETTTGPVTLRIGQFQANLAEFPSEHR
jgi:ribosome maturation factor RimP